MTRFKGGFSVRGFTCLIIFTLCGRINGNEPVKVVVKEDSDAILPCSLSTKENIEFKLFDWKKDGQKEVFYFDGGLHSSNGHGSQDLQFKGRVSHFSDQLTKGDASIKIQNTKVTDSGNYTCVFPRLQPSQTFHIELVVERVIVKVKEDSDVILPCSLSTKEDIQSKRFDWKKDGQKEVFFYNAGSHYNNGHPGQDEKFKGRVSHFQDELQHGNASIIIRKTTKADSGDYTCDFPDLQPTQTFHIKLVVDCNILIKGQNISGAAPKPYVTIIDQTHDWSLLQCEVLGASRKPEVEWRNSSGKIVPAEEPKVTKNGDKYDVILQTTVTKTDRYQCVVTQEEICHQIASQIFVHINEKSSTEPVKVFVNEGRDAFLPCSLSTKENIVFTRFEWRKDGQENVFFYNAGRHSNNGHPGQDLQFKGRVSHFQDELQRGNASIIISNTKVADSGNYTCIFHELQPSQTFHIELVVDSILKNTPEESSTGDPKGWIVGAFLGALAVVAVLGVLYCMGCIQVNCRSKTGRQQNENSFGNPPVSDPEQRNGPGKPQGAGNLPLTDPLLDGSDVPAQTSPV